MKSRFHLQQLLHFVGFVVYISNIAAKNSYMPHFSARLCYLLSIQMHKRTIHFQHIIQTFIFRLAAITVGTNDVHNG